MSAGRLLRRIYLSYFSQPSMDRPLYGLLRHRPVRSIVELGVGQGQRARRMLQLALEHPGVEAVRYTGIDLFEDRPQPLPGLSLKQLYRLLNGCGVRVQLIPGDPLSGLARAANTLSGTDLLVISEPSDAERLAQAWYYVPRMLHADSLVYVEQPGAGSRRCLQLLTAAQIAHLAGSRPLRRAA